MILIFNIDACTLQSSKQLLARVTPAFHIIDVNPVFGNYYVLCRCYVLSTSVLLTLFAVCFQYNALLNEVYNVNTRGDIEELLIRRAVDCTKTNNILINGFEICLFQKVVNYTYSRIVVKKQINNRPCLWCAWKAHHEQGRGCLQPSQHLQQSHHALYACL